MSIERQAEEDMRSDPSYGSTPPAAVGSRFRGHGHYCYDVSPSGDLIALTDSGDELRILDFHTREMHAGKKTDPVLQRQFGLGVFVNGEDTLVVAGIRTPMKLWNWRTGGVRDLSKLNAFPVFRPKYDPRVLIHARDGRIGLIDSHAAVEWFPGAVPPPICGELELEDGSIHVGSRTGGFWALSLRDRKLRHIGKGPEMPFGCAFDCLGRVWMRRPRPQGSWRVPPGVDLLDLQTMQRLTVSDQTDSYGIVVFARADAGGHRLLLERLVEQRHSDLAQSEILVVDPESLEATPTGIGWVAPRPLSSSAPVIARPTRVFTDSRFCFATIDVEGKRILAPSSAHVGSICCVALSPKLDRIATVGNDKRLAVWSLSTRRLLASDRLGGRTLGVGFAVQTDEILTIDHRGRIGRRATTTLEETGVDYLRPAKHDHLGSAPWRFGEPPRWACIFDRAYVEYDFIGSAIRVVESPRRGNSFRVAIGSDVNNGVWIGFLEEREESCGTIDRSQEPFQVRLGVDLGETAAVAPIGGDRYVVASSEWDTDYDDRVYHGEYDLLMVDAAQLHEDPFVPHRVVPHAHGEVTELRFLSRRGILLVADKLGYLTARTRELDLIREVELSTVGITAVDASTDETTLVAGDQDGRVFVVDMACWLRGDSKDKSFAELRRSEET